MHIIMYILVQEFVHPVSQRWGVESTLIASHSRTQILGTGSDSAGLLDCFYVHIHVLGSSARFARATVYGIILQDYIMGLINP